MPRFFVSKENINEEERIISILGEDAFHIARSLRMAVGDGLTVCDGEGRDYDCTLTKIRDSEVNCEILNVIDCPAEPPYKATVYQALVKGERLDVAIQKSVEFGASAIVPFESSRCIVRMKGEKEGSKSQRRRRIAAEAAKQCGRGILPEVKETVSFEEMIRLALESELRLFCYEGDGTVAHPELLKEKPETIGFLIGPEGDFSPREIEAARAAGFVEVTLGNERLRTETAALATAMIAQVKNTLATK